VDASWLVEEPMSLTPFLLFDGNCAEAMVFYQACLGGELALTYAHLKAGQ
jgi:uncharacterized glyoxalase superfamily protein PhnB